ncbi:DUF2062 domain-containing protein [Aquiflexum gelatinilyticum]|uniref:DUF2062 domain-containing protein n=1 Tax=Aquiflexum gelatinilyticum TaxID=2961943 RepID=UPI00216A7429|nr:DUF2062 domain-containing protein [Aquiflexum gelatinilyticum]MCS4433504.1 DUF2062 domain-containing protein [Aquiflexum gelatinilyticum]
MRLRNLGQKLKGLLKQGLTPKELALSISIAVLIGVFPIYGTTTFILAFLALRLRLNLPIMIAVSYVLTPAQILLIIPFARLGEFLFGFETLGMDMESLQNAYTEGFFAVISKYSGRLILAVGSWLIIAVPVAVFLYIFLFQVFRAIKSSRKGSENKISSEIK